MDITNTGHDMFCPGMNLDADGRAIVTGGSDASKTSAFRPSVDAWIPLAAMNIARGYQASTLCSDGRTFTIGGSWNGALGGKNGEIYDGSSNTWTLLPGCPVAPMLTNDQQGIFRQDNHGWLFGWKNGYVFQAGPSSAMNWYGTGGSGSQTGAGKRGTDPDSMNGNAIMYDAVNGKILTVGGSPSYGPSTATSNAHIITIGEPNTMPTVESINPMWYARAFANGVVLPNGEVFITGGQLQAMPFTDTTAVFISEIWNPTSTNFVRTASHAVPRTYHSIALLMLDGRVFTAGGGMVRVLSFLPSHSNPFQRWRGSYSPIFLLASCLLAQEGLFLPIPKKHC
jgi:galactose oxidase